MNLKSKQPLPARYGTLWGLTSNLSRLSDFAVIANSMLRTLIVRDTMFVCGCLKPFNKWPTIVKLKLVLKLRPMEWSNCLKCHSSGSLVSIIIFSKLCDKQEYHALNTTNYFILLLRSLVIIKNIFNCIKLV